MMRNLSAMVAVLGALLAADAASATCCGIVCVADPSALTCYTDVQSATDCSERGVMVCGRDAVVFFVAGTCDDLGCTRVDGEAVETTFRTAAERRECGGLPP